jgi:uncharacterized protein with von Willebrand factor type A (vWA) domain
VAELRAVGVPIALSEKADALRLLTLIPLGDRDVVRATLSAVLIKSATHESAFRIVFDVLFPAGPYPAGTGLPGTGLPGTGLPSTGLPGTGLPTTGLPGTGLPGTGLPGTGLPGAAGQPGPADGSTGGETGLIAAQDLPELLGRAIETGDRYLLRLLAGQAVTRYSGFTPGRPVAGTYYVLRTLRELDLDAVQATLRAAAARQVQLGELDGLGQRLGDDRREIELSYFRSEVEAHVRRLIAQDRGADALIRSLRSPLPEDLEFRGASAAEVGAIRASLGPLSRRLAGRLRQRRRAGAGRVDFRRTIRRSLAYGGVPAELRYQPPRPAKPELVVLADLSGSVASFARFTLELMYAVSSEFSKVRSFAFVDGLTEVTAILEQADGLDDILERLRRDGAMLWVDGHSDYGHAFRALLHGSHAPLSSRSTMIILGDARNNYHASQADALGALAGQVRQVFWLNPEPRGAWDSGDSIMSEYARLCDGVFECRTLRQLQGFVEALA